MSIIATDGFDLYNDVSDMLLGRWNFMTSTKPSFVPGRFGGQALRFSDVIIGTANVGKVLMNKYVIVSFGASIRRTGTNMTAYVRFDDVTGSQFCVTINPDGSFAMKRGDQNGTLIGIPSITGIFPSDNSWHYFEALIWIGNNSLYEIRMDGEIKLTGTFDTQALPVRNFGDLIVLGCSGGTTLSEWFDFDDFYVANNVDKQPNNSFLNEWRVEVKYPSADTAQKDFIPTAPPLGQPLFTAVSSEHQNFGASIIMQRVQSRVTGTVTDARVWWMGSSSTAKSTCVVYSDNAGSLGTLIGTSNENVGLPVLILPEIVNIISYTFSSPPVLLRGRYYWIGVYTDTAVNIASISDPAQTTFHASNVYASGPPTNPTFTVLANKGIGMIFDTTTTSNFPCIDDTVFDYDSSYVETSVGGEDLYIMPQWIDLPIDVYAVQAVSAIRKTKAGGVGFQHHLKSEWNEIYGLPIGVGIQWKYYTDLWPYDPNTGLNWQSKAVNALKAGFIATETSNVSPVIIQQEMIIPQPLVLP